MQILTRLLYFGLVQLKLMLLLYIFVSGDFLSKLGLEVTSSLRRNSSSVCPKLKVPESGAPQPLCYT